MFNFLLPQQVKPHDVGKGEDGSSATSSSTKASDQHITAIISQQKPFPSGVALDDKSVGGVQIRTRRYGAVRCEKWCSCLCHTPKMLQTPAVARTILGLLFVDYAGIPAILPRCDQTTCRRQVIPSVKVSYYFPPWLLHRVSRLALEFPFASKIQASLKAPRVVPDNAEVFVCAVQGDLNGMRRLFEQGLASPGDVGIGTGRIPLHVSIALQIHVLCSIIFTNMI